ncbi:MAG: hypothetical protein PHO53_03505 [Actinomycetota bacterium]|nr:hypothetical protein [Actinomycetota bacterium]
MSGDAGKWKSKDNEIYRRALKRTEKVFIVNRAHREFAEAVEERRSL